METFRTFKDAPAAEDLAQWLTDRGIKAVVVDTSVHFDPSFAYSILSKEWAVRIAAGDFTRAGEMLHHFYEQRLDGIPRDYYLFSFTDQELEEILRKPDEWGDLDYALAQHILQQRGRYVTDQELRELRDKRYETLSKPEEDSAGAFIGWGYGLSIAGGFIGSTLAETLVRADSLCTLARPTQLRRR